jgi:hypothetical protein
MLELAMFPLSMFELAMFPLSMFLLSMYTAKCRQCYRWNNSRQCYNRNNSGHNRCNWPLQRLADATPRTDSYNLAAESFRQPGRKSQEFEMVPLKINKYQSP